MLGLSMSPLPMLNVTAATCLFRRICLSVSSPWMLSASSAFGAFVNFETPPVHPVALNPDVQILAVCNLPDARIELFDVSSGSPVPLSDVPVGLDPVSVRFQTTNELWVVNHISGSLSIVDVAKQRVVATIQTEAGPADVAFAGVPRRAFVSCATANLVQIFDAQTRRSITNVVIDGERPKSMATSADGSKVYVAIFESGNGSTIVAPALTDVDTIPGPGALEAADAPDGGQVPPPNNGATFNPPINPAIPSNMPPPRVSHIVRKSAAGRWLDDNHGDWTEFVSGTNSFLSSRVPGWDLPDHDLAILDASTLQATYASGLMNICMNVAVNPASGLITVIGTDATNERRFQPNLRSTFVRVAIALVDPASGEKAVRDLNPHLDYLQRSLPQSERDKSIGDPRGIVWNSAGTRGYVTGMGSRNLVVIDAAGNRTRAQPIELNEGPTGLALDEAHHRLYILNRFSATISVLDTVSETVLATVPLFDPTPDIVQRGRKHLYDTRRNSGLGQVACASCHVDARMDRLAWDLGDPSGTLLTRSNAVTIFGGDGPLPNPPGFTFHPMKGPMITQTLQDIIGHEPFHWRGDRAGLEDFKQTFTDLLGRDNPLTPEQMKEFKDFLATLYFPPNRFRNFDGTLSTNVPLPGMLVDGAPDEPGSPLRTGDAVRGRELFTGGTVLGQKEFTCASCHNPRTGLSHQVDPAGLTGPQGERHLGLIRLPRQDLLPFKGPQFRNLADKTGLFLSQTNSRSGFGFLHDGRVDTLRRFLEEGFGLGSNAALDVIAFLLSVTASEPPFPFDVPVKEVPPAIGRQMAITNSEVVPLLQQMLALAASSQVDLIVRGVQDGLDRSWFYDRLMDSFQSDRNAELLPLAWLMALAAPANELTFTVVPRGCGRRLGVDRDGDGYLDRTELDEGFSPHDSASHGTNTPPRLEGPAAIAVHPEQSASIPYGAVDLDSPAQRLTFRLLTNAPSGAVIDASSGLFTWTPGVAALWRRYEIGIQVSDDGSPPLSDERGLVIHVTESGSVEIVWIGTGAYGIVVVFRAVPGQIHRLEFKDALDAVSWNEASDSMAYFTVESLVDFSYDQSAQRFYRVVVLE